MARKIDKLIPQEPPRRDAGAEFDISESGLGVAFVKADSLLISAEKEKQ